MTTRLYCLALAAMLSCSLSQAQPQTHSLTSGNAVMTIDADGGAKIISLTIDGQEVLAQHQKPQGMPFENPNDFGSTFWPSPQSYWNWPPIATYDSKPYTVSDIDGKLTMTSGVDEKFPFRIAKQFAALGDARFEICYTITNEGDTAVSVAPWEITRVPSGGVIRFEADDIRPADIVEWTKEGNIISVVFEPARQNRKYFADAQGWLSHENNGIKLVKRFPHITPEQAAPGESEVEIYYNFGQTYTEIENQGAYTELQPGESLSWTVTWEIEKI